MNGEPFCYGSRMTVRQLLEERRNGYDHGRILTDHPELKALRVATAWAYAAEHRGRYAEFVGPDGSLVGPGFSPEEAAILPEHLRIPGGREGVAGLGLSLRRAVASLRSIRSRTPCPSLAGPLRPFPTSMLGFRHERRRDHDHDLLRPLRL